MEKFFEYLVGSSENVDKQEFVPLRALDMAEKKQLLATAPFDIDFFCVTLKGNSVLEEPDMKTYFSASQCRFYKSTALRIVRTSNFQKALILGEIGEFKFAVPVFKEENDTEEMDSLEMEFERNIPVEGHMKVKALVDILDTKLKDLDHSVIPFREFKDVFLKHFFSLPCCVYQYGQKQPLEDFMKFFPNLFKNQTAILDIAIAMEINKPGSVLLTSNDSRNMNEFYSFLLSKSYGNVLLKDKRRCQQLVEGSHRVCVYNTFYHTARKFDYEIKILNKDLSISEKTKTDDKTDKMELLQNLFYTNILESVTENVQVIKEKIFPAIAESKLRIESYFSVNSLKESLVSLQRAEPGS